MTNPRMGIGYWLLTVVVVSGLGAAAWSHQVWAHTDFAGALWSDRPGAADVAPVDNALYLSECGDCHFPYQPGLMPARGWEQVMNGLSDHFGDDAELDDADFTELFAYLMANAADVTSMADPSPRSVQISTASAGSDVPLRISELPYIKTVHAQVPAELIKDNPKVEGGPSQCDACHVQAEKGYYNDSNVDIPGHGRWND